MTQPEILDPCDCATLRARVEELVHGEIAAAESKILRAHLEHCPECADEEDALQRLTAVVKRACQEQAPAALREIIVQQLREIH